MKSVAAVVATVAANTEAMDRRILLGLSGGIDSAVSAHLLSKDGYDVTGVFFSFFREADPAGARAVATQLGIDLVEEAREKVFSDRVIRNFVARYKEGKTPNPCADCNRFVKIASLCETADKLGIPLVATGHYARIVRKGDRYCIREGADKTKDQSYFLWRLTQEQLSRLRFPLGEYQKKDLRVFAEQKGYVCAGKPESQEICFIPGDDYVAFLESFEDFPADSVWKKGNFVDRDGNVLGEHKGIIRYTVGQRRGLGIAMGARCFVHAIDAESGDIVLSTQVPKKTGFIADALNFVSLPPFEGETVCTVRTRYRAKPVLCRVTLRGNTAEVICDEPTLVCPGQSAVFYNGETLLFGGVCR